MYKDKDKQREANREAMRRNRAKGITQGITEDKVSQNVVEYNRDMVIPERTELGNIRVSKPGDDDYVPQCETTRAFIEGRDKRPETDKALPKHEVDFIEKVSEIFNVPTGMTNQGMTIIDEAPNVIPKDQLDMCSKRLTKRGKDIKCFADLPSDVQATIDRMSISDDGVTFGIDRAEHAKRTAAAIKYQHLFPDRYHNTGAAL